MRVLQLTLSFAPGGRRRAISTLVAGLVPWGVECDLCCLDELGCPREELEPAIQQAAALGRRSLWDLAAWRRLARFCRERNVELIHAHDAASQFVGAAVSLALPGVRLVETFHRSLGFESARRRDRWRNAVAIRRTAAVVTGSRERQAHYRRENHVPPERVIRIPFGIDTQRFRPSAAARAEVRAEWGLAPDDLVIGAVGHFGDEKGIDLAIDAYRALLVHRPKSVATSAIPTTPAAPAESAVPAASAASAGTAVPAVPAGELNAAAGRTPVLVVVGDGSPADRARIESHVAAVVGGRVVLAGFRRDVERCFAALDVLLHLPRLEAFGLVLAEAMAVGLPIVAARVGGVPDLVLEGHTGLLVPAQDPPAAASALATLVADAARREQMGRAACERANRYFWDGRYAQRHVALYRDVLAGRRPRGVDE